jgi:phenylalanyl-tRNA synthetase alpha chain
MENPDIQDLTQELQNSFIQDINADDLDWNQVYLKYLGKKGLINQEFQKAKNLDESIKLPLLKELNKIKAEFEIRLQQKKTTHQNNKNIDLSTPVLMTRTGNLHPLTLVKRDLYQFFHYYGFSVYDGPEVETDYYNFEIMGVGKDHPARDLQDTLYILEPEFLLRTQTSSIEARVLKEKEPPIRFVVGDNAFRNETDSRSNTSFFHQFQGVYLDKNVTMGHLKWIFTKALKHILGEDTVIRFRPKYYPEVEPGMSPDILCKFCKGSGCEVCKKRGWIEIAGGGMIHPSTLEKADIDPRKYSGFAFGWGLDRIVMQKYKIDDIRVLYNGSLIYL